MSAAGRYGIARAWRVLVGVFAGFIIVMLLCALFSVALASLVPKIMPSWSGRGRPIFSGSRGKRGRSSDAADGESDVDCGFWAGFVLEFVNVKIMLYGVTALTSFVMPAFDSTAAVAAFAVLLAAIRLSRELDVGALRRAVPARAAEPRQALQRDYGAAARLLRSRNTPLKSELGYNEGRGD